MGDVDLIINKINQSLQDCKNAIEKENFYYLVYGTVALENSYNVYSLIIKDDSYNMTPQKGLDEYRQKVQNTINNLKFMISTSDLTEGKELIPQINSLIEHHKLLQISLNKKELND